MAGRKETAAEYAARMTEQVRAAAAAGEAAVPDDLDEAMPGVIEAEGAVEVDDEGRAREVSVRERLLGGMDPELAKLLSDEDIDDILAEEKRVADEQRRERARKEFRTRAQEQARADAGLISDKVLRSRAERERLAEKKRVKI